MNYFFRLITIVAISIAMFFSTLSCSSHKGQGMNSKEVVVLFSDNHNSNNRLLQSSYYKEFKRYGIDANIQLVNIGDYADDFESVTTQLVSTAPNLIVAGDDYVLDRIFLSESKIYKRTPIVFGGIRRLDYEKLSQYPLATGYEDKVDLVRNLEIAHQFFNSNYITVAYPGNESEYDYLLSQLSDSTRFIISDYSLSSSQKLILHDKYKKEQIILVDFIKSLEGSSLVDSHPLVLDGSLLDVSMMAKVSTPQVSCVADNFLNKSNVNVLGGYFASQEVQIRDVVKYCSSILKGAKVSSLPILVHEKDFYLDYKAMRLQNPPLISKDWSIIFTIKNAPLRITNPLAFTFIIAFILLLCVALISVMRILGEQRKTAIINKLNMELSDQQSLQKLLVGDNICGYWEMDQNNIKFSKSFSLRSGLKGTVIPIREFVSNIRSSSRSTFDVIYKQATGFLGKTYLIEASFDSGNTYHWWKFVAVSYDSTRQQTIGVIICNDEQINARKQIQAVIDRASEVKVKETFLANISQDLRTPLDAITGFAQLLVAEDGFTDLEKLQFYEIIKENTDKMLSLIDNVVEKSKILTSNLSYNFSDISVRTFLEDIYRQNHSKVPQAVLFDYIPCHEDATIRVDAFKLSQVVNSLISVAFTTRKEGNVSIGWRICSSDEGNSKIVEIFVGETGVLINSENELSFVGSDGSSKQRNEAIHSIENCREIIENQSGSFGYIEKEGESRRFLLRFPSLIVTFFVLASALSGCTNINSGNSVSTVIVSVLLAIAFAISIERFHRFLDIKTLFPIRDSLRQTKVLNTLLLQSSGSYLIDSTHTLSSLRQRVHPDSLGDFNSIERAFSAHSDLPSVRIKLLTDIDINQDLENYSWYELRDNRSGIVALVNIDDIISFEAVKKRSILVEEDAKKKESFIMNVSHEMRTPLNAISGFSQIIAEMGELVSDKDREEMAVYIRENSTSLINLVTNVLQFSLLESDQVSFTTIEESPKKILEPIYMEWVQKTPAGVEFIMIDGRENLVIDVDPTKIRELMDHYLSNAFKFTKSGTIVMGWDYNLDSHEVELFVEDTGCGISEEKKKEVFGLFWKDNEFVPGLGLGLNISKALTELMGGHIHISSQEGVGSKIGSVFPAKVIV